MSFSLPMSVTFLVDAVGSVAMLLLAVAILYESYQMRRRGPIHLYLFLLALSLGAFSISRALGHVVKVILLTAGYSSHWKVLSPISGGINTITFIVIAASSVLYGSFRQLQRERDERYANYLAEIECVSDFLQQVIDSINDHLLVIDPTNRIRLVNQKLINDLGVGLQDLVGKKRHEVITMAYGTGIDFPNDEKQEDKSLWELINKEKRPVVIAQRYPRPGRQSIIMEIVAVPILTEEGEIEYIIETHRDITEKVKMEQQLRDKEKLQGVVEMATAVAHELNTPMFIVLGNAQLIKRRLNPDDPLYKELEEIIQEVKRMSELTRKMSRIRQYEAKDYVGNLRLVDIDKASEDEEVK